MADYDVIIAGGGPAGLSSAISLAKLGLSVAVVERQKASELEAPPFDGRDIALTNLSRHILDRLGAWDLIDPHEVSPIECARVLNADGPGMLRFDLPANRQESLGFLVSNHIIRRALFGLFKATPNITLLDGEQVISAKSGTAFATVGLSGGQTLTATLLIAADSRFSELRKMMGLTAEVTPFDKSMHVFRVRHEKPHRQTAFECFNYGHTLALLPLNGLRSSVVLTVKTAGSDAISAMSDEAVAGLVTDGFGGRFGKMEVASTRHAYPLTAVYARQFVGPRFALVGDAAVGMHPVTAHGFNFGLAGQATLASLVAAARSGGVDIGSEKVLDEYEMQHKRATRPLYLATNAIVRLYTNDSPPAKFARSALLTAADIFFPAKKLIMSKLGEMPPLGALR